MADTIPIELLTPGTFKGVPISEADLDTLVANHAALKDHLHPPVKLGHSGAQILKGQDDGDPALGWIERLERAGSMLIAHLANVPTVVREAIDAKRYRAQSAEIWLDWTQHPWERNRKTGVTGKVITGVALLGAELPAVSNLKELTALLSAETGKELATDTLTDAVTPTSLWTGAADYGPATVTWSVSTPGIPRTIEPNAPEGPMADEKTTPSQADYDDLKAKLDELATTLTAKTDEVATLSTKAEEADAAVKRLTAENEQIAARASAAETARIATEADAFVTQFSADDNLRIFPNQASLAKTLYCKLAAVSGDPWVSEAEATTLKLSETRDHSPLDVFRAFIAAMPDQKELLASLASPKPPEKQVEDVEALLRTIAKDHTLDLSKADEADRAYTILAETRPDLTGLRSVERRYAS